MYNPPKNIRTPAPKTQYLHLGKKMLAIHLKKRTETTEKVLEGGPKLKGCVYNPRDTILFFSRDLSGSSVYFESG